MTTEAMPVDTVSIVPDVLSGILKLGDRQSHRIEPAYAEWAAMRLPYHPSALEPFLSAKAIRMHCGPLAQFYTTNVLASIRSTGLAGRPLEDIVRGAAVMGNSQLERNACTVHNHWLYWRSMKPDGGGMPQGKLLRGIEASFGSWKAFVEVFRARAANRLWAGWLWLTGDARGVSLMHSTENTSPLLHGKKPLLALDLWELAYYVDYGSDRGRYVETFLNTLVDWQAAESRFEVL